MKQLRNKYGRFTDRRPSTLAITSLVALGLLSLGGVYSRATDTRCNGLYTPIACEDVFKVMPAREAQAIETAPEPPLTPEDQRKEIEAYIRKIFGKQGDLAIAVAQGECRGFRQGCKLVTPREHSVCHFQINLKAHFDKVPGKTIEDKERWLTEDHRHCTLIAKIIYDNAGGFTPWSAFLNESYKKFL